MNSRFLAVALLAGLMLGCASISPPESEAPVSFVVPTGLSAWSANGKFSFLSPENRESGQFYWTQNEDDYLLRLVGPFGVGTAEVERDAGLITIRARGETYQGDVTEQLLLDLTGISVPLNQLSEILMGDSRAAKALWQVDYGAAMQVGDYLMPQRLTLSSGDQELQIFISRWSI